MIVSRSGMPPAAWTDHGHAIVTPCTADDPVATHATSVSALRLAVEWPAAGVVVVRIGGEIDLSTVPRLTEVIRQRLTAAALNTVILDLSGVSFASSAAIELLLHSQRRADHRGVQLFVVPGGGAILRLLTITGLRERFVCRETAAQAVADAGV
ncbi:STAS domain-containing protein [Saccharopolyspora phatthalungensis]|uniref:Anti-sigma factor antagonist n=1 Tax=Saccharopolyspora phatthalungensis TaxID=664693 RepID=A0A840QHD5_9PSEU|nr:STAS domain-containing protein [Saccharopolyspora phatthalungensis]MBB5158188.1 anti-anti-sigma factor [Saccharopolyspora phatthalungensis]